MSHFSLSNSVANLAVFSRIWACFLWSCCFFEDLRVACFNWNLLVFHRFVLWIVFFSNFMALSVLIYCWRQIGSFFVNICSFWACFSDVARFFFISFSCQLFILLNFLAKQMLGLLFKLTCLFLQNNLASLLSSCPPEPLYYTHAFPPVLLSRFTYNIWRWSDARC